MKFMHLMLVGVVVKGIEGRKYEEWQVMLVLRGSALWAFCWHIKLRQGWKRRPYE
jgi:hypothetical protein